MSTTGSQPTNEARLSRMLFEAREAVDMYRDLIQARSAPHMTIDGWLERLRRDIDEYRAEQGWSPNGFGGESSSTPE